MNRKLAKLLEHISKGTLIWRIRNHSKIERERKWINFQNNSQPYLLGECDGFQMRLYRNDLLTKAIFLGEFERLEVKFLQRFLETGDVFLDIGANIGLFSLAAAAVLKKKGHIHSFEPSVRNYEKLIENIALNNFSNVKTHNYGVSDKTGKMTLYEIDQGLGALSSYAPLEGSSGAVKTEVFPLDEIITREQITKVTAIKIDVEGWEYPVIKGANDLFSKPNAPLLMVEFTDSNARSAGYSCQLVYDTLVKLGYDMYKINENLKLTAEENKSFFEYSNLICLKKGSSAHARVKSFSLI